VFAQRARRVGERSFSYDERFTRRLAGTP